MSTRCEVCGNDYYGAFTISTQDGATHVFDCFECAMTRMAPVCEHCRCRILGHGCESDGRYFCSAHCARAAGIAGLRDNVSLAASM